MFEKEYAVATVPKPTPTLYQNFKSSLNWEHEGYFSYFLDIWARPIYQSGKAEQSKTVETVESVKKATHPTAKLFAV